MQSLWQKIPYDLLCQRKKRFMGFTPACKGEMTEDVEMTEEKKVQRCISNSGAFGSDMSQHKEPVSAQSRSL